MLMSAQCGLAKGPVKSQVNAVFAYSLGSNWIWQMGFSLASNLLTLNKALGLGTYLGQC